MIVDVLVESLDNPLDNLPGNPLDIDVLEQGREADTRGFIVIGVFSDIGIMPRNKNTDRLFFHNQQVVKKGRVLPQKGNPASA